jgi:hypothetical protein
MGSVYGCEVMKLVDLLSRWQTGEGKHVSVCVKGSTVTMFMQEHEAPLGDFLR